MAANDYTTPARLADRALEQDLLTLTLRDGDATALRNCAKLCAPSDFSHKTYGDIWAAAINALDDGATPNLATLAKREADPATRAAIIDLAAHVDIDVFTDPVPLAAKVHDNADKLTLWHGALDIARQLTLPDYTAEQAVNDLQALTAEVKPANLRTVAWPQLWPDIIRHAEALMRGEASDTGIPCGVDYIDRRGGLRPGDLDIIAGRTSNGKTSLAMTMALDVARAAVPVLVFSLEMPIDDLTYRLAAVASGLPAAKIERTPLEQPEFDQLYRAIAADGPTGDAPLLFDRKRSADFQSVTASIRAAARDHGVKVVVIDYAQLLHGKGKSRNEEVGGMANDLKALAVELDVCIILLSQLARQQKGATARPRLSELKESGDLENAADNVWLVYRAEVSDENYTGQWSDYSTAGTVLVINPKSRKGPIGEFMMGFDPVTTRFYDRDNFDRERPDEPTPRKDGCVPY